MDVMETNTPIQQSPATPGAAAVASASPERGGEVLAFRSSLTLFDVRLKLEVVLGECGLQLGLGIDDDHLAEEKQV